MRTSRPIIVRPQPAQDVLESLAGLDPVYARLFAMRGITARHELDYGLANLAPVSSLDNVDAAVDLLLSKRGERIVVVGDFDVDGATSTAMMLRCLREFDFKEVDYLVPSAEGVLPVEVKAGAAGSLKSLHQFLVSAEGDLGIRLSSSTGGLEHLEAGLGDGRKLSYRLRSVPLYLAEPVGTRY